MFNPLAPKPGELAMYCEEYPGCGVYRFAGLTARDAEEAIANYLARFGGQGSRLPNAEDAGVPYGVVAFAHFPGLRVAQIGIGWTAISRPGILAIRRIWTDADYP